MILDRRLAATGGAATLLRGASRRIPDELDLSLQAARRMFFNDWTGLLRTPIVGVLAYVALIACLRISGKRTLSKMNAFDLVVTVALGSTLSTILINQDVALAEGVLALAVLIGLQFIVAWLCVRFPRWQNFVKSEPRLLLYRGQLLDAALRDERLTKEEVQAALRSSGLARLEDAGAVVLETDGSISVIPADVEIPDSALEGLMASGENRKPRESAPAEQRADGKR